MRFSDVCVVYVNFISPSPQMINVLMKIDADVKCVIYKRRWISKEDNEINELNLIQRLSIHK